MSQLAEKHRCQLRSAIEAFRRRFGIVFLNPGSIVAMDRSYSDCALYGKWTEQKIYFVTRLKDNASYEVLEASPVPANRNILADELIQFTGAKAQQDCPFPLRRITAWDAVGDREIVLLTTLMEFGSATIAAVYKDRWEIELFFKALKQNLKVKSCVYRIPIQYEENEEGRLGPGGAWRRRPSISTARRIRASW